MKLIGLEVKISYFNGRTYSVDVPGQDKKLWITRAAISISDKNVAKTIAMLKNNYFCEKNIIGGECATPGIISLISVCENQDLKNKISLDENSNVLVIGCEGDADEILYKKLLDDGKKELGI